MTSARVVELSINVTTNSPSQDYTQPDDHNVLGNVMGSSHLQFVVK